MSEGSAALVNRRLRAMDPVHQSTGPTELPRAGPFLTDILR